MFTRELNKFRQEFKGLCEEENIILPEVTIDEVQNNEENYWHSFFVFLYYI